MENKRLTTKCDSDEYIVGVTTNGGYDEDAVLEKQYEANNKLGKLEDLEEQLDYPLKILIKVIVDQNVYVVDLKDYRRTIIKNGHIYIKHKRKDYILPFEDYGKTWLLKGDIIKNG